MAEMRDGGLGSTLAPGRLRLRPFWCLRFWCFTHLNKKFTYTGSNSSRAPARPMLQWYKNCEATTNKQIRSNIFRDRTECPGSCTGRRGLIPHWTARVSPVRASGPSERLQRSARRTPTASSSSSSSSCSLRAAQVTQQSEGEGEGEGEGESSTALLRTQADRRCRAEAAGALQRRQRAEAAGAL